MQKLTGSQSAKLTKRTENKSLSSKNLWSTTVYVCDL